MMNLQGQFPACPARVFIGATTNMSMLSQEYYDSRVFGGNPNIEIVVETGGHLGPLELPGRFAAILHEVFIGS